MTMNFKTILASLVSILESAEAGRFETVSFQRQRKAAANSEGVQRKVQVFYKGGIFPDSVGQINGPFEHHITYQFDLTVAEPAKIDLATLNDENASAADRITALAARQEAADLGNQSMDTLFDIVFQIIMDARNRDLGLDPGIANNRWINQFQKDDPVETGELVVLTAAFLLTCKTDEDAPGDTGVTQAQIAAEGALTTADIETEALEDTTSETNVLTS